MSEIDLPQQENPPPNTLSAQRTIMESQIHYPIHKKNADSANFFCHGKTINCSKNSLFIFSHSNSFRQKLIWLIEWKWFDRFITLVIVLNTIFLTLQDYSFRLQGGNQQKPAFDEYGEYVFISIFTLEFIIKVVGLGFAFEKYTYLRDGWNIIDFFVVLTGFLSFYSGINLSAARTIRILRPLRSIHSIKGIRFIVGSLIGSLPALGNLVLFLLFILILFGILGLQVFLGVFENRCRFSSLPLDNLHWPSDPTYKQLCVLNDDSTCPDNLYCRNPAYFGLPIQEDFMNEEHLNYGFTTFDDLIKAILSIFQILTGEGWSKLIYLLNEAVNPIIVYTYFLLFVFLGGFFLVNLIVAVINESFLKANQAKQKKKKFQQISFGTVIKQQQIKRQSKAKQIIKSRLIYLYRIMPMNQLDIQNINDSNRRISASKKKVTFQSPTNIKTKNFKVAQAILIHRIIETRAFIITVNIFIILNTVTLAMDRYPIDQQEVFILNVINLIFTVIFTLEMIIKLIGYGVITYFKDTLNIFDCVIVLISLIEIIISSTIQQDSEGFLTTFQAFRALRLFRMFKLAKQWKKFAQLIYAIVETLKAIIYFLILLLLFIVVSALLGMELFAYKVRFDENGLPTDNIIEGYPARAHFEKFYNASIAVFILITNEQWNQIAYDYMRNLESMYPSIYFISVVIIGNFIILKLFMAMLLYNFGQSHNQNNQDLEEEQQGNTKIIPEEVDEESIPSQQPQNLQTEGDTVEQSDFQNKIFRQLKRGNSLMELSKRKNQRSKFNENIKKKLNQDKFVLQGYALFIFGPYNMIRRFIARMILNSYFDGFIILLILLSSVLLAMDDPLSQRENKEDEILFIIESTITAIFILEAILKIITFGLVLNGQDSYLRQIGNLLDLLVIIFSSFSFSRNSNYEFQQVKILRVFRVLRPLRLIARNQGLKIAINSLIISISQMLTLTVVCLIFFFLFGILGVNLFKGKFYHCTINLKEIVTKTDCFDYGGSWINQSYNFDNILNAMVALFVISTTEGWVELMFIGIDSKGIDQQPQRDYQQFYAIFFISFVIVGAFFVINLFAGVIVDTFLNEKNRLTGLADLNNDQQEWVQIQMRILESKPIASVNQKRVSKSQKKFYRFVSSTFFEYLILFCILMNTIVFTMQFHRAPSELDTIIFYANMLFLAVFIMEAILKIYAMRKIYFYSYWNIFDFFVVIITFVGILLELSGIFEAFGTATSVLRTFRIFRILRLVKNAKSLRVQFQTLVITLPALANIGGLLAIILFMFSVIGMYLYPYIKPHELGINSNSNFTSFFNSFFTLFKCSTGEEWNIIQADASQQMSPVNVCFDISSFQDYQEYGLMGCGNQTSYLFFISFQILFTLIMLNLFVAVIIDTFQTISKNEKSYIKPIDIEKFQVAWSCYDNDATGYMNVQKFSLFMLFLPQPFGWQQTNKTVTRQRLQLMFLDIPVYIDEKSQLVYYYYDVLKVLAEDYLCIYRGFKWTDIFGEGQKNQQLILASKSKKPKSIQLTEFTSAHVVAAGIIQKKYMQIKFKIHDQSTANRFAKLGRYFQNPLKSSLTRSINRSEGPRNLLIISNTLSFNYQKTQTLN